MASTPGTHPRSNVSNWGLSKMAQLLNKHAIVPNEDAKNWPLYYQCSSIGSLGKDPSAWLLGCLLYTSPSPRDRTRSRMPSSA